MGGRAGAAALEGDRIYFDVLKMSFSADFGNRPDLSDLEAIEFFAHETHHLGSHKIIDKTRSTLDLSNGENMAFRLLSGLVGEGSATYLINGRRDLEYLLDAQRYRDSFAEANELLRKSEEVLQAVLGGSIETEDDFDIATSFTLGRGLHTAGSFILSTIDQVNGLKPIMEIISDPRKLLIEYNKAAEALKKKGEFVCIFDFELVNNISAIGNL